MHREHVHLIDEILDEYRGVIGEHHQGYRNHVCRMVSFALKLAPNSDDDRRKLIIAGCFHDIGIWTGRTFDYLEPSIAAAMVYLEKTHSTHLLSDITAMISQHHKIRRIPDEALASSEAFRKADLVDVSLGILRCGLDSQTIRSVKDQFPNAGFHRMLAGLATRWICRHPLDPVPVLKW